MIVIAATTRFQRKQVFAVPMASHKSLDGRFTSGHKRLNRLTAVRKGMHDVVVCLTMEETLRLAWSAKEVLPDRPC